MTTTIRPAIEQDQPTITKMVNDARINPRNLHWQRFLIAEEDGKVVGIRQVKIHSQGTREVGSGYVLPAFRRKGISAALMNEILKRESGTLYLLCDKKWAPYYEQFGFKVITPNSLPADLAKEYWIGKIITSMLSVIALRHINIIPMIREK